MADHPGSHKPKKQRPRRGPRPTRGEEVRRKEFVQAEKFAKDLEGAGSARAGQARRIADNARRALLRQQQETRARVETGRPVRPRRKKKAKRGK